MDLSHFEIELSLGESVQIGNQLITVIDTPDHGLAVLVELIPEDDDFDVVADFDSDAEVERPGRIPRPR